MSIQARAQLCKRLIFQDDTQRADLMDPAKTQTQLIALLLAASNGRYLEITAVRTDHHDDSALGEHCHANGFAVDCWPLHTLNAGDYLDAGEYGFSIWLASFVQSDWLHNVGLAGSALTYANLVTLGGKGFQDDGGDHVHLSA